MKYPPYACKHCGLANADMFYDWYIHTHNTEPTKEDWDAFQAYRQLYESHKEQEKWQNNITGGEFIKGLIGIVAIGLLFGIALAIGLWDK